jgi:hypothetical protein
MFELLLFLTVYLLVGAALTVQAFIYIPGVSPSVLRRVLFTVCVSLGWPVVMFAATQEWWESF